MCRRRSTPLGATIETCAWRRCVHEAVHGLRLARAVRLRGCGEDACGAVDAVADGTDHGAAGRLRLAAPSDGPPRPDVRPTEQRTLQHRVRDLAVPDPDAGPDRMGAVRRLRRDLPRR